ncbi:MAG: ketoacyl-ACP synthase III [Puniceicoccales bacterium]|jgi:3-oxoacyl-[acyl-carrier-protein] synthase-3|nr:ketoacyl-ACP synthase III [Puniceicoccales bacterium]
MKNSKQFVKILGVGSYVPEKVVTNDDLSKVVDTSDEWIRTRTGIRERRIAAPDQTTSDLCVCAARKAMENASIGVEDIDLILTGTITSDVIIPSTSVFVQTKLGLKNIPCFDYNAACSGLQYGIEIARSLIESQRYKNILLICGDKLSAITDWQDRSTCVLFGDGAGAVVLSATENEEENSIIDVLLGANGEHSELITIPAGGSREPASEKTVSERKHFMKMSGRDLFREAVKSMGNCAQEILDRNGMSANDVDFVVTHQANWRIIDAVRERLDISPEKVCVTIDRYGNTSASSCIIAIDSLIQGGKIVRGSKGLTVGFGAGLTWGAAILKF